MNQNHYLNRSDDQWNQPGGPSYMQQGVSGAMGFSQYVSRTFRWMGLGLLLTFATAATVAYSNLFYLIYGMYLPLTLVELGLVFFLSARVTKIQVSTARTLFLAYSVLNGLVMSLYFVMFDHGTLIMAFLAAALYFGIMAVYGHRTGRDLLSWGPALRAGLLAMIITSLVGLVFRMSFMTSMLYSGIGLGLFMLITARDVQLLQHNYQWFSQDDAMLEKSAIYGALSLYLDFINIFLYVLQFFARSRDN